MKISILTSAFILLMSNFLIAQKDWENITVSGRNRIPQESGNHTGIRWIKLSDEEGNGFIVTGDQDLSTSVWPLSQEDIYNANHTINLHEGKSLTVNIDLIQAGVGGNDSWSDNAGPIEKYRILPDKFQYSFVIQLINKKSDITILNNDVRIMMR